ncbi:MAG: STAS/SEC14 domain-containing protein [Flavobacteriaceae bacterium]|nr:STAS/SEC14 domain-containing protein [Flavobacteriaceae bacterium]MDH3796899.1 STAS/SEC14 domain-containing protein [Flavobacteriaceae bacterium]
MKIGPVKKPRIIREYTIDIGAIQVYENFLLCKFNEGSTLTLERAYQIIGISEIHFRNRNFGIISVRKHAFALDPTIYSYLRELPFLKAFAIVSLREMDMHNFNIERLFYKNPMEFFIDYRKAVSWVNNIVKAA